MLRSMTLLLLTAAGVSLWAGTTIAGPAETAGPVSAEDSDPRVLGWMQGFPPPPEKLIGQPDSNYFSFPKLRWTVCHLREFLPTEQVSRGLGAPLPLERAPDDGIDAVTFTPLDYRVTKEGWMKSFWFQLRGSWLRDQTAESDGTQVRASLRYDFPLI